MDCSKTVPKPNQFSSFGLALSEKQIPQIVENNESRADWIEPLEATGVREKQVFDPCSNRVLLDRVQAIWVHFEREADSPNY
jgi:hypothetical protein